MKSLGAYFGETIQECAFIIWTTTPWTIPANVAVSIGPEIEYSLCESSKRFFVIASDLMKACEETWGSEIKEISRVKGSELTDIVLEHPYLKRDSILIHGDHVTIETGTGCVHTAPALSLIHI